jgi:hypothetical protein
MSDTASVRPKSWSFRADIPQRYNGNARLYLERGGLVRLDEDAKPFADHENFGDASRLFFFCLMQDQIFKEGLQGDFAELGVYKGMTAAVLARIARRLGRTAYLFDTFEGFSKKDLVGIDADKRLEQFTDTSLDAVRERVGTENVRYIQGRFPESTDQISDTLRFCLVHIDCDLYEPIGAALNYFYPRMVPGGFMVIHDYSSLAWNGAERAVDEFFADKLEYVIPLTDGCGSAVVRRAKPREPRVLLTPGTWIKGGQPALSELLVKGWSNPESWGVWGIGESHTLAVPRPSGPCSVELDCSAALVGPLESQEVTVSVSEKDGERILAALHFTKNANRGVRTVQLPKGTGEVVTIVLRPAKPIRPSEHNPASRDTRILGVALYAVRCAGD